MDVLALRMASLLLTDRPGGAAPPSGVAGVAGVAGVVEWFGAMQSQDLSSGLWSLGARLPGLTRTAVVEALERGEAVRTWPMRGTVHLVPGPDARWMVELMAGRIVDRFAGRRAELGLSPADAEWGAELLGAGLAGGRRLTRRQCLQLLDDAGLDPAGQRGYHLLGYAAQRGVICLAPDLGTEQSFVLLDDWVPGQRSLGRDLDRDEALATMARRYFRSHGPTTRADFAGWTGLTAADAKRGIAVALSSGAIAARPVDGVEQYADPMLLDSPPVPADDAPLVLPGFDEYLLGYKDRSLMVAPENLQAIIPGGNGVFQATVVRRGRVVATWRRSIARDRVTITVHPLPGARLGTAELERAFRPYGAFLELPVQLRPTG